MELLPVFLVLLIPIALIMVVVVLVIRKVLKINSIERIMRVNVFLNHKIAESKGLLTEDDKNWINEQME
jgi:hypothetical protein